MAQHIIVKKFDSAWESLFNDEKAQIKAILGDNAIEIYHIGSTAVKGLSAKPIIDIMPVVKNLEEVDLTINEFEKIGYEYLGEFGIKGRRYLRKGGDERTHQIHIFKFEDKMNIVRHLAVRDYLRFHTDKASAYGALKDKLAKQFPYDIDGYCTGKEKFMQQLEQSALNWYGNTIRQANICDFDDIMQIWEKENIKAHNFISQNYWKQNYTMVKNALYNSEIYVYVSKGKIEGFIGLSNNYIEGIFIKENKQHKGIGSELLNTIKKIKSTLTLSVFKKNLNAINFYLKNDFTIINESIDECTNESEYTMQWNKAFR